MKKVNSGYIVTIGSVWIALLALLAALFLFSLNLDMAYSQLIQLVLLLLFILVLTVLPGKYLKSNLNKNALAHQQTLEQQGFIMDHQFLGNNGVYFLDTVKT